VNPNSKIILARRIAADTLTRREKWLPGVKAGIYEEIIAGRHDDEAIVQIALTAIESTTELAAKLADQRVAYIQGLYSDDFGITDIRVTCQMEAERSALALRAYDHLKGLTCE
jgi:hypothetical protein